jgi:hypothetical protein
VQLHQFPQFLDLRQKCNPPVAFSLYPYRTVPSETFPDNVKVDDPIDPLTTPETLELSTETQRIRHVFKQRKNGPDSGRHPEWMVYNRLAVHER